MAETLFRQIRRLNADTTDILPGEYLYQAEIGQYGFSLSMPSRICLLNSHLAELLGMPAMVSDFWKRLEALMPDETDRRMLALAQERLETEGRGKAFVRLKLAYGFYWWYLEVSRSEDGRIGGRLVRFDEAYYTTLMFGRAQAGVSQSFQKLLACISLSGTVRVWHMEKHPAAGRDNTLMYPDGSVLVFAPDDAPAPDSSATDCGLSTVRPDLYRRLAEVFAARAEANQLARDVATVFMCLSSVGRAFGDVDFQFQPIVRTEDRRIVSLEMLARLGDESFRVMPEMFIPVFERGFGMLPFGRASFERIAEAAGEIQKAGLGLSVSYNYSAAQSMDSGFEDFAREAMARYGVTPKNFVFELTETSPILNKARQEALFAKLRAEGGKTAIDDFQTGYNSIDVLLSQPFDLVKFGGPFARYCILDGTHADFFKHLMHSCRLLGCKVCVEHVRSEDNFDKVKALGCEYAQGFLFGRSVPLADVIRRISENPYA